MSDFILLTDRNYCPNCRRKSTPKGYGQCRGCGMMLFDAGNDFRKYELETGFREYWVYISKTKGFVHRSHLLDFDSKPLEIETPLAREYKAPELPSDYGTPEYGQRLISEQRETARTAIKKEVKRLKRTTVPVSKIQ